MKMSIFYPHISLIDLLGIDFFFFLLGMWDLSSPTRDQMCNPPAVEAQS